MHDPLTPVTRPEFTAPLFKVCGLRHRYPDNTEALAGIDLDIAAGDRIALVGQNGSGKTTLIKHLCGLLAPSSGALLYRGGRFEGEHLEQHRLEVGILFQDPDDQLFGYTLLEDAAFGPRQQGLPSEAAEAEANRALAHVGLRDMAYKAPHRLSYGQKKRAALAGILAMHPDVLLLDEPTANLDSRQEEVFLELLKGFEGTLICISHDLVFLYELCDRVVVLDSGRVHHDYSMRELVSQRRSLREHGLDFSFRLVPAAPSDNGREHGREAPAGSQARIRENGAPRVLMRDYHYRYPDGSPALCGVDLTLHEGDRISLVGENGAGKTTLLSCLLGLREGRGEFLFDGLPVARRRRKELWRHVGMMFQDCADQLFCPSVYEEVAFGLRRLGYSRSETRQRVHEALVRVHLDGLEQRVPLHLSGGERKRLALASVLAMEPQLLILDEPTAGLDPRGEELLLEILRKLPVALLIVSHDMFFVRELTDRTLIMHQGRILSDLPTHDFLHDSRLADFNGLAFSFRERCHHAIWALQHEHEHSHLHYHLHSHPHRHNGIEHEHLHEHAHEHRHRFVHSHPGEERRHDHLPSRYHEHEHPENDHGDHDHPH
jgi:energy-coupling factor transporter ATP-binding protein EcfA2